MWYSTIKEKTKSIIFNFNTFLTKLCNGLVMILHKIFNELFIVVSKFQKFQTWKPICKFFYKII